MSERESLFQFRDLIARMEHQFADGENFVLTPEEIPAVVRAVKNAAEQTENVGPAKPDGRAEWRLLDLVRQEARDHRLSISKGCLLWPENACRFCKSVQSILGPCRCKRADTSIASDCPVHGVTPGGANV